MLLQDRGRHRLQGTSSHVRYGRLGVASPRSAAAVPPARAGPASRPSPARPPERTPHRQRSNIIRVTTGSKELDTLLQGGIETGCITEAHGEFKTGKTQLSHTLCVTSQMSLEDGGGAGKVCYIDTENTFRPERIKAIAERFGLDPGDVLENIIVARAYTSEHQSQIITEAAAHFTESPFRMLIIDSLTGLWRVDYCGRGELADRQQKLNHRLAQLLKIAEEFNIAVFVTNQVTANPDGALAFAPKFKPIGGHIVAHACTIRLSLIKSRGDERICKVVDSPSHAESDARFLISDGGVADV